MITKRKLRQVKKIIKTIRVDKNLFRFAGNLYKLKRGRYKTDAAADMPHPSTLMLELTNKCNLHCITCPREYGYGRRMDIGNMDTALARDIIDSAYPYLQSIGLTGMGETLFAPNLKEIAEYIKSRKRSMIIFISTNANFEDFIERISPVLPFLNTVQISIDGVGEGYERIRHGGSFKLLERNIAALVPKARQADVDIMLNMVITKQNYTMMRDVIRFAHDHGVGYVNFTYFNLASVTDIDIPYYGFFRSEDYRAELTKTLEYADKFPDMEITGLKLPEKPGKAGCALVWNHFQINHDGEVPPCCAKPFSKEMSFGNVRDNKLMEVINSKKAKAFRSAWIQGTPPAFCEKCHYLHLY